MHDTLHLDLTDEELKDLLRRGFAYSGNEAAMPEEAFAEFTLLVRRFGFAAFLEVLESAERELSRPPDPPDLDLTELVRQNEEAIAAFDARLQELPPTYQPGDRVEFLNEEFVVHRYQRGKGMTGYWLRQRTKRSSSRGTGKSGCGRLAH